MRKQQPKYQWKIDTNDRYQKAVHTIISLSTASLILPTFFLREFLNVAKEKPLWDQLNWFVGMSWILFGLAIVAGIVFYYASAKWIKQAWGIGLRWPGGRLVKERCLEMILDWSFRLMMILFFFGVIYFILFATFAKANA
jgi:hypothetical protein